MAQHNRAGCEWSADVLSALMAGAFERSASVLIDDACYALHSPRRRPTNALRLLLDRAAGDAGAR